ncbi:hypothetical protein Peur_034754 [Populus x canadensis]
MQAMIKMMERVNFVMGNVCDRLEKVGKHGNVAGTCTQDVRKLELNQNQTMAVGPKGQGGLIMRILRRLLMILVMVISRMRP